MVMIWQAVSNDAARIPMRETSNSWLSLLNFMRFLRRGPFASGPLQLVEMSRNHSKSHLRVLRMCASNRRDGRGLKGRRGPGFGCYFVAMPPCGIATMAVGWASDV